MVKEILGKEYAKKRLIDGVNKLADATGLTLGPRGQNVALFREVNVPPLITNDGVSIAKEIILKDPYENMGAQLVIEVASSTNNVAGDGTTTSTVLTREIVNRGLDTINNGNNPILLKEGMNIAINDIKEAIVNIKRDVESTKDIKRVATISSGSKVIGELIGDTMEKMGKDGIITLDDSETYETKVTTSEGYEIDRGFLSHLMINDNKREKAVLKWPMIFITNKNIRTADELLAPLRVAAQEGKPLLIISDGFEGQAMDSLLVNMHVVPTVVIKAPGFGEDKNSLLEDIACITGAKFFNEKTNINLITPEDFGSAKLIEADKYKTIIINGNKDIERFNDRVENVRKKIDEETDMYLKDNLIERLAKLNAGIAVIKCGAKTETEQAEMKLRIEDSINATKASISYGIVAGGGATLLHLTNMKPKKKLRPEVLSGYECVINSLDAPFRQILSNADIGESKTNEIIEDIKKRGSDYGYDAMDFEIKNFIEAGIIDPAKVTITALENAVSVAGTLLTTNTAIMTLD